MQLWGSGLLQYWRSQKVSGARNKEIAMQMGGLQGEGGPGGGAGGRERRGTSFLTIPPAIDASCFKKAP